MFVEYGKLSTKMYEITKPVGHSIDGDIEYYYEQLKNVQGLILEAGVGTGRMMIPFIQKGLQVEGVDLSREMLNQCQLNMDKADVSGNIYQGDLTKLDLEKQYEAIIMPTGSFCLLPRVIIKDVLTSLRNHLKDKGTLILDIELPAWFNPGEVTVSEFPLSDDEGLLFTSTAQEMDWHEQKVSYIHRYELIEKGIVKETEISNFTLYWYGIKEFEELLRRVGFVDISYRVGYEKNNTASLITFFARN
ncbi:class I SAM-dependent methyltransferase [Vagococcus hydrophili]|uniref:Class I SAM-dependent methyltransferase n=1 Tax=Vagococcus hydrophili TaxID=2714947 RepID=A0A6G8ARI1_9ENTE|nr:class I SAM-dependent methyltransferase [Vagococcus hydrophili]QIL47681.1 class I SAM-dependent methyltransferase [Vagococcus hydrophili]